MCIFCKSEWQSWSAYHYHCLTSAPPFEFFPIHFQVCFQPFRLINLWFHFCFDFFVPISIHPFYTFFTFSFPSSLFLFLFFQICLKIILHYFCFLSFGKNEIFSFKWPSLRCLNNQKYLLFSYIFWCNFSPLFSSQF